MTDAIFTGRPRRGVSLYSYQEEIFLGKMTLEDCIAAAAKIGANGIEVIPEQSFATYPDLDSATVANWWQLMDRYGTHPVAVDAFMDLKRHKDRLLTLDEGVVSLKRDIDIARTLGASVVRVIINTPPPVVEACADYAAEQGVRLAVEVHSPMRYDHRWVLEHLDVIYRVDNGFVGLLPDMGTFVLTFPRVIAERALRDGGTPHLVEYITAVYNEHPLDMETLPTEVAWRGGNPVDVALAGLAGSFNYLDPKVLLDYLPHVFHIQAKFYEMTEDYTEFSVPYDQIIPVLLEGGYSGYLSSEYEGNRHLQDAVVVDSVEQVRRQHEMFRRLLGEDQPAGHRN